jgi:ABC-type dipeptide/oligopeptide/nickel transport systems, permease components
VKNPIVRRFLKRKVSIVGLVILALFFFMAAFGPLLFPEGPLKQNLKEISQGPSLSHPCGTDYLGRDIFIRIVYGARVSLSISFTGVLSGCLIGIFLGVIAGYFGGWIDSIISRFIDVMLAFPGLLLAIVIVAILGNGTRNTIVAIAVFSIPSIARMVRGVVMQNKDAQYIGAAKVMGESSFKIICTHIIPNSASQMIVNVTLNLGTAILTSSSLSFLGLGVQPPNPEWGAMLNKAKDVLRSNPWEAIFPGIVITLVVMSFSLVGDGLRDALDPKLKNTK